MATTFRVYVRDASGARIGEANELQTFTLTDRHRALGAWELRIPWTHPARALIWQPGAGIELERTTAAGPTVIASGPFRLGDREYSRTGDVAILYGVTDLVWLARRLAHPQPASLAPPYSTNAYDVRTGAAETIIKGFVAANVGTGATAARKVPGFTNATDLARGATTTAQGRWQPVLDLVSGIAARAGLGLRCTGLTFDVYQPVNRAADGVEFSLARGNLEAFRYRIAAPEANYLYVGGSGAGTARTIYEGQDPTSSAAGWGRVEAFADRRDTTTTTDLQGTVDEQLTAGAATSGLSLTVIDTPTCSYGVHYELGDTVALNLDGSTLTDVVEEVTVSLTGDGTTIKPVVGDLALRPGTFTMLRRLADLEQSVRDLERYL